MQLITLFFKSFFPYHSQLKILESTWDVGGDYLSDVEIDYDDSKHKSSKSVISGESQSLLPALTVPDSELMVSFFFRPGWTETEFMVMGWVGGPI